MRRRLRAVGIASVAVLLSTLLGCGGGDQPRPAAGVRGGDAPVRAVATVAMVGDIVQRVAGGHAVVSNLIGEGVDPHLYKPTRNDVAALQQADIIFYNGLLLEGKMSDALVRFAQTRPVHAVTELVDERSLLELEHGHYDPHLWMDVGAWMKAVQAVAEALAEFDPAHGDDYRANAAAYTEELRKLDDYARAAIATIPQSQRLMVTAHDAFNYFGRAYGIDVMGVQGISTESEAGLADINRLTDTLVQRKVPAVFFESSVPRKSVEKLIEGAAARGWNVTVGGQLFSDAMGPAGTYEGTYVGMIDHNVTTVVRALGGQAPPRGMNGNLAATSDAPQ